MKKTSILSLFLLIGTFLAAQTLPFNSQFKPFYHGVASGDPLEDRVVIWTRVTTDVDNTITGNYVVATDTLLKNIVKTGAFSTDSSRDYTVKVDVTGLQSNTTYYYAFSAFGRRSSIGRTKTTPSVSSLNLTDILKFAVVSCANYEGGYFNAYARIADRNDLNAVIHLGDYLYEYGPGAYRNAGLTDPNRVNIPSNEIVSKAEYRLRYSLYHLEKDLQRLHQQHPFISVWDDHESANNAYDMGAGNHQDHEGDWNTRKRLAKEACFEWMPIRGTAENTPFYRMLSYGKLMDLFVLDTRLEGRQKQPIEFDTPEDSLNPRRIISPTQYSWLINNLKNSVARWKIVGSQVVFSSVNTGFASVNPKSLNDIKLFENLFVDSWEGYLLQRNSILDSIQKNKLNNIVFISGDSHVSWAFDLNKLPVLYPFPQFSYIPRPNPFNPATGNGYNPQTGEGAQGVEFATPSISSANFAETLPPAFVANLELVVNKPQLAIEGNPNYNPHLKFIDFDRHGYFILDVRGDSVQADYFYVPTVTAITPVENWGKGLSSRHNSNRITTSATPTKAAPKALQDIPAPTASVISPIHVVEESIIFSLYPNPTSGTLNIQYGLNKNTDIDISLVSLEGKIVKNLVHNKNQSAGIYTLSSIDVSDLGKGIYFLQIKTANNIVVRKLVIH